MKYKLYLGSYASKTEEGIYQYTIEEQEIRKDFVIQGISNPSYLAVSQSGDHLYAVMEDMTYEGNEGGGVAAFVKEEGDFQLLNTRGTKGTLPCHILLDEKRNYVLTANYMSGSVSMFHIEKDGSIGAMCDFIQHVGEGPNKERQEGPHVHFLGMSLDQKGIWSVDLGVDTIFYYEIDEQKDKLVHKENLDIHLPAGVGPRHFVMGQNHRNIMYIVCELTSEVIVVEFDGKSHHMLQRISTLDNHMSDCTSTCAAIKLSPDGRFLYVSNRGDDSIAVFEINSESGCLRLWEIIKTEGKTPRDFAVTDDILVVANQESDNIAIFNRDSKNGELKYSGERFPCNKPVCTILV